MNNQITLPYEGVVSGFKIKKIGTKFVLYSHNYLNPGIPAIRDYIVGIWSHPVEVTFTEQGSVERWSQGTVRKTFNKKK